MNDDLMPLSAIPPQDIEAERDLLGALLDPSTGPKAIGTVATTITPSDFVRPEHVTIYERILALYEDDMPFDVRVIEPRCRDLDLLPVEGPEGLAVSYYEGLVVNGAPWHWQVWMDTVRDRAVRRGVIATACKVITMAQDPEIATDEAVSALYAGAGAAVKRDRKQVATFAETVDAVIAEIEARRGTPTIPGLPTGIGKLDFYTDGMQPRQLWTIAAPTSMGKSALAARFARKAADRGTVLFFSLEMSQAELVRRMLAAEAHHEMGPMVRGVVDDMAHVRAKAEVLKRLPLVVEHSSDVSPGHVAMAARQVGSKLALVVVDYLQILSLDGMKGDNHERELDEAARRLKLLACDLNVPVLMLSQLNRQFTGETKDSVPSVEMLRGSGAIGQHSDVVILMHSPQYAQCSPEDRATRAGWDMALFIAKNRQGPRNVSVDTFFDVRHQWFGDPFDEDAP